MSTSIECTDNRFAVRVGELTFIVPVRLHTEIDDFTRVILRYRLEVVHYPDELPFGDHASWRLLKPSGHSGRNH